jgi:transposase
VWFPWKKGFPYSKEEVFDHFDVGRTQGYEILKKPEARRVHYNPLATDYRSESHRKVTKEHIERIEEWFEAGIEAGEGDSQWLPLETIAYELDIDITKRAMQKNLSSFTDYRRYIACQKEWISPNLKARRVEFCRKMLEERPSKEDYRDIRYSDEVHVGYGPRGKLHIYRKPGQRQYPNCIQRANPSKEKDLKRLHAWGVAGWEFRSPLVFYDIPLNDNGKMTQQFYRDHILEQIIKPWLQSSQSFWLEEDGDSGHGPGKNNIVRKWKEEHHLSILLQLSCFAWSFTYRELLAKT